MDTHLRAGIAIYNAGRFHAAHDAWEDHWLKLPTGSDDERFLHGIIQFTAAIHHGYHVNWVGLQGLAESGAAYLAELPSDYRRVNVGTIRSYLEGLRDDPERIERIPPPPITVDGQMIEIDDLDFEESTIVALVLADESEEYDDALLNDAIRFARIALEQNDHNRFEALIMDFAANDMNRGIVYDRLESHVNRRRSQEEEVTGLFGSEPNDNPPPND